VVFAKKRYGQHFLADANIARKIADSLFNINKVYQNLLK
jgi:16S rRNA A1518/A1519 N6-dimethyltransferase RsmA/KsgA/DIM1 with predicted DNA glycosylase/AP lyase activity